MKKALLLILVFLVNLVLAQRQNTYSLFYNLPIDSNSTYIQKILLADSVNFEAKMVGRWRNKSHVKVPLFYPKEKIDFFGLDIESTSIQIDTLQKVTDSIQKIEIELYVKFGKTVKSNDAKLYYNKTVEFLKSEYDSLSTTYMLGSARQKNLRSKRKKYKEWKVYEYSTMLYTKNDKKCKLEVIWFDERKHGQTLLINYRLN